MESKGGCVSFLGGAGGDKGVDFTLGIEKDGLVSDEEGGGDVEWGVESSVVIDSKVEATLVGG